MRWILFTIPFFLTACFGPRMFGMAKEDFEKLSEKERVIVIKGYNERKRKKVEAEIVQREKELESREKMAPIDAMMNFFSLFTKGEALSVESSNWSSLRLSDGRRYQIDKGSVAQWNFGDKIEIYKSNDLLFPLFLYNVTRSEGRRAERY